MTERRTNLLKIAVCDDENNALEKVYTLASRPVCDECAEMLIHYGVNIITALKHPK